MSSRSSSVFNGFASVDSRKSPICLSACVDVAVQRAVGLGQAVLDVGPKRAVEPRALAVQDVEVAQTRCPMHRRAPCGRPSSGTGRRTSPRAGCRRSSRTSRTSSTSAARARRRSHGRSPRWRCARRARPFPSHSPLPDRPRSCGTARPRRHRPGSGPWRRTDPARDRTRSRPACSRRLHAGRRRRCRTRRGPRSREDLRHVVGEADDAAAGAAGVDEEAPPTVALRRDDLDRQLESLAVGLLVVDRHLDLRALSAPRSRTRRGLARRTGSRLSDAATLTRPPRHHPARGRPRRSRRRERPR